MSSFVRSSIKRSSAVFVTATTDFFGFLIFLGLATLVLL
jgi:magnesium transporter